MRKNLYKKKRGFTLIEIVASLGLLAVGVLSVLAAFSLSMKSTLRSGRNTEAGIILQRLAEEEKLKGFDMLPTGLGMVPAANMTFWSEVTVLGGSAVGNRWVQKRVTVAWEIYNGKWQRISVDLFILDQ